MLNRYDVIELSKIYKRILEVEITLKQKMEFALRKTYAEKMFFRIIPYLKSLENKNNEIEKLIINKNLSEQQKTQRFLTNAYISEVLNILTRYKAIYKYTKFQLNFYGYEIENNKHKEIISYAAKLISLRNSIMHFNIKMYKANRENYLQTLIYWEKLLDCENMKSVHNLSFTKQPSAKRILQALADTYPDFLALNDRLICDMFDDVAFINGWDINKLPQYWTLGRILYELRHEQRLSNTL